MLMYCYSNYQNIDTNDVNANTAVLVDADNVTIVPSSGKHTVGSSKVKVRNVVDYSWEHKFYPGQILAIHISGTYIAYGIQGTVFLVFCVKKRTSI